MVSIADTDELIPLTLSPSEDTSRVRQFPAVVGRRMTGRPLLSSSSKTSLASLGVEKDGFGDTTQGDGVGERGDGGYKSEERHHKHRPEHHVHQHDKLLLQVSEWLQREKAKRAAKKSHRGSVHHDSRIHTNDHEPPTTRPRTLSQSSDSSAISLERLQRILEENMTGYGHASLPHHTPEPRSHSYQHRRPSIRRSRYGGSSDTEYQDGDVVVPTCDVVLDNSKTLSYSGGANVQDSANETVTLSTSKRAEKERRAWVVFKTEIVKLAHTLRLKGWRRLPLENGADIEVKRLSGALTNAVYVVSPPLELSNPISNKSDSASGSTTVHKYKPPPKLLLRIYGPQVEHLIDRENELGILRRLARKKIGPRLLGTFTNGRFEEFFNAQTLTAADLRIEDTSKQIAKRMRELHDGIDLLESEREEGPFVWQNWDKWVGRCSEVIKYLDQEILSGKKGKESWRSRGLICGVEWKIFHTAIDRYRKWLDEYYGSKGGINRNLVFAHNDVCTTSMTKPLLSTFIYLIHV